VLPALIPSTSLFGDLFLPPVTLGRVSCVYGSLADGFCGVTIRILLRRQMDRDISQWSTLPGSCVFLLVSPGGRGSVDRFPWFFRLEVNLSLSPTFCILLVSFVTFASLRFFRTFLGGVCFRFAVFLCAPNPFYLSTYSGLESRFRQPP